uniref:Uncharacterized protein n=1 Tax=Trichinella nativa TaxID=6335 RepID=A0A0V1KGT5_9BILA
MDESGGYHPDSEVQNTQDTVHKPHETQEKGRPKCG